MSQRTTRINELIQRELNTILRTIYQKEATAITITDVEISPDLRQARIFYSVLGDSTHQLQAQKFLKSKKNLLKKEICSRITIKYTPNIHFIHDKGLERGTRIVQLLDEIDDQ